MNFFDLHCDTAFECACMMNGRRLSDGAHHLSLDRAAELLENNSCWTQVFAIFMPDENEQGVPVRGDMAVEHYENVLSYIKEQEELFYDRFRIVRYADDLERKGVCNAVVSVEGGSAAAGSLARIREMYDDGVRLMTLTWNADNELGSGVKGSGGGLTAFGREAVRLMEELGMIVDVSHLSDAGFYDVERFAQRPFVASHSCSRALCGHPRNLTDEMFGIIRERSGLVGINFSRGFLCEDENACAEDIIRHCEHFFALGGEDIICMGSDFDGTDMPNGIDGIDSMVSLYDLFIKKGFGRELADKIFFDNAHRFFSRSLKAAPRH